MNHLSDEVRTTIKELALLLHTNRSAGAAKLKEMETAATPLWFALMDALRATESTAVSAEVNDLLREVFEELKP